MSRYAWSVVTVIAVVAALVVTIAVVREQANKKDTLRRAQIALAAAPSALTGVLDSPAALLAGGTVAASEYPLNKKLRDRLTLTTTEVNRFWHAPIVKLLSAQVGLINARTARMMALIAQHRLRDANAVHDRYIEPLAERLGSAITRADSQLTRETQGTDRAAWHATLGVVGVAGALLALLVIGLASGRRRRLGTEVERRLLLESERRLRALVEHGSDLITVVERDTTITYQAGPVDSIFGFEPGELRGTKLTTRLSAEDRPSLLALCATEDTDSRELQLVHHDGSQRMCEVHATNLLSDSAWQGIVLNIWDLSERKALEERLRYQAFHDTLTGLANRALVRDRAEQMLARARRGSTTVAALYVDLDGFKQVNDRFGHAGGDQVLRAVGERLKAVVREQDTVGRLGGDEFVVLLEPGTNNGPPGLLAERLLDVLRQPIQLVDSSKPVSVSASIGLAVGQQGPVDELLEAADLALYEAKRAGRDRFVAFEMAMQTSAQDRLSLETELVEALEAGQFFLLYQPIFDLSTERMVGVEALVRWHHPIRGVVAPDHFIPVAEETGLIVPIGHWVLQQACAQAATWHSEGHEIGVSVNVSARQLDQQGWAEDVQRILAQSEVDPSSITLEITETALMRDIDAATARLKSLKALGVRIAIDDFGTGHSALAYLRKFPIDSLKIDRSFIAGITSSDASAAIIRTLVQLGKTLEIQTLAEGIEEPSQLEKLQSEHCDHGQGFLFARPLDAGSVHELLESSLSKHLHADTELVS